MLMRTLNHIFARFIRQGAWLATLALMTFSTPGWAQTPAAITNELKADDEDVCPHQPDSESPKVTLTGPVRDFEMRLHYPEVGPSVALYRVKSLSFQAGFGTKYFGDYSFLEPYLETGGEDIVNWTLGYTIVLSAGLAYDFPVKSGLLFEKDSVDLRVAARVRGLLIAKLEGVDDRPNYGQAGVAISVPLSVGVTWTYWILPDSWNFMEALSRFTDFGYFLRLEAGPDFVRYFMYQLDGQTVEPIQIPRTELLINFTIGLVF